MKLSDSLAAVSTTVRRESGCLIQLSSFLSKRDFHLPVLRARTATLGPIDRALITTTAIFIYAVPKCGRNDLSAQTQEADDPA